MKQISVEWLVEQLTAIRLLEVPKGNNAVTSIIDQAKEMEKQHIIDAFIGYDSDTEDNLEVAEQYYNETFEQQ
jgi:hypothetical protein